MNAAVSEVLEKPGLRTTPIIRIITEIEN